MRVFQILSAIILSFTFFGCQNEEAQQARGFALPGGGDADRGQEAFVELKCYTCHEVDGLEDELPRPTADPVVGVTLGGVSSREPADGELLTSMLNPNHSIYPAGEEERVMSGDESRMADYTDVMTVRQMLDLIAFLHDRYRTVEEHAE